MKSRPKGSCGGLGRGAAASPSPGDRIYLGTAEALRALLGLLKAVEGLSKEYAKLR